MKKTYIAIIVLVLVLGGLFFAFKSKTLEAPVLTDENQAVDNFAPESPATTTIITTTTTTTNPVVCTMDAKLCPDGSYVGRTGPKCEFTACPSPTSQAVKEFVVSGQNFSFTPSLITVKKGDKVKITFKNTSGFHDFKIDEYGVAAKQTASPSTEILEFTADKTGSFEYYCSVGSHRAMGMVGTLKVE